VSTVEDVAVLTTEDGVDVASPADVRVSHKLLLLERAAWVRRTELHEARCIGLEELLHELVDTLRATLVRQKNELERVARIASEVVTAVAKKTVELENA
jgi:hypothetical protein